MRVAVPVVKQEELCSGSEDKALLLLRAGLDTANGQWACPRDLTKLKNLFQLNMEMTALMRQDLGVRTSVF